MVGFGKWHGEEAAFKRVQLGKIEKGGQVPDAILNPEKSRAEFEVAKKLSHENIVKVLHVFRYQKTGIKRNERRTNNWTVIVMEKHYKNIGELNPAESKEIRNLLKDSLGRVFNNLNMLSGINFKKYQLDSCKKLKWISVIV